MTTNSATSAKLAMPYEEWSDNVNEILVKEGLLTESQDGILFPIHDSPSMVYIIAYPSTIKHLIKFSNEKGYIDWIFSCLRKSLPYAIIIMIILATGLAHNITG